MLALVMLCHLSCLWHHCKHYPSLNPASRSLLQIQTYPDVLPAWAYRAWDIPCHCALQPWSPHVPPTTSPIFPDPAWGCRLSPTTDPAEVQLTELLPPTQTPCPSVPMVLVQVPAEDPVPAPSPQRSALLTSILAQQWSQGKAGPGTSCSTHQLRSLPQEPQNPSICVASPAGCRGSAQSCWTNEKCMGPTSGSN